MAVMAQWQLVLVADIVLNQYGFFSGVKHHVQLDHEHHVQEDHEPKPTWHMFGLWTTVDARWTVAGSDLNPKYVRAC